MTKDQLIQHIHAANIADDLKSELLEIVNAAQTIDKALSEKLMQKIDQSSSALIEEIESERMQEAAAELEIETTEIEKDMEQLNIEINKQADQVDMESAH